MFDFLNVAVLGALLALVVYVLISKIKQATFLGRFYYIFFTVVHFLITIFFAFFLEKFTTINDPQRFYKIALESDNWFGLFGFGNTFMSFITYPLAQMGVSLESCFVLFSFVGWLGFLKLFQLLNMQQLTKIHLYHLFFFMPSLHLWTSSLSKEPLLLFFIAIILSSAHEKANPKKIILGLSFLSILLIRPHVFFILSTTYLVLYHLKIQKINNKLIGFLVVCFIGIAYLGVKYFLKIDTFSIIEISEFLFTSFERQSQKGNTGISIIDTNLFERIFYLLLMPLPYLYDTQSVFQLLASIENIFYVIVLGYLLFGFIGKNSLKNTTIARFDILYAFVNTILMIVFFGSYIYNQGLANRMRIMIYPFLFYILISNINSFKLKKDHL